MRYCARCHRPAFAFAGTLCASCSTPCATPGCAERASKRSPHCASCRRRIAELEELEHSLFVAPKRPLQKHDMDVLRVLTEVASLSTIGIAERLGCPKESVAGSCVRLRRFVLVGVSSGAKRPLWEATKAGRELVAGMMRRAA